MGNIKVRELSQEEYEKLTKAVQKKRIEMAYIASACFTLIALFQIAIQAGKEHGAGLEQLKFWALAALAGWLPSLWFFRKNKKRKDRVLKGKAMGVLARCLLKERVFTEHHGENTKRRYQYHFFTEFGEQGIAKDSESVGGAVRQGEEFYIIKTGKRDIFFAKL